jgi:hypothetical protein
MIKSKTITDHKLLKDVHEESLQNPRQKQPVPVQPSGQAFEGVWMPRSVLQINIEDVWTSEQHRLDDRSISIQQGVCFLEVDTIWEVSTSHPDDAATRLDDVQ